VIGIGARPRAGGDFVKDGNPIPPAALICRLCINVDGNTC